MNKTQKNKNSSKTLKSIKSNKTKETLAVTSRTPKPNYKNHCNKKSTLQKFKSIPTITFRDRQSLLSPQDPCMYESYGKKSTHLQHKNLNADPVLLYSVSERHNISNRNLSNRSKKKKGHKVGSNHSTSIILNSVEKLQPRNLQHIFEQTKSILDLYRIKEQNWQKQKKQLLKQLQKYKKKCNNKDRIRKSSNSITLKTLRSV